ncbi:Alkaline phytoceramidase (APHC) [Citrus sinensis]|nr:Alkaline phytoceramidase (APHC) [Citrus sinensis]
MVWLPNQQIGRVKRTRIWAGAFLCLLFFMLATPKFPSSRESHLFADLRNFFGVPNTLNVLSNFPFLIAGVMGFVLTLQGIFFNISFRGEVWGWALFYAGITGVAFGSAYYHLKPDDDRVMWDTLPMMIAYASLFSSLLAERVDAKIGLSCLIALVSVSFLSMIYARVCVTCLVIKTEQRDHCRCGWDAVPQPAGFTKHLSSWALAVQLLEIRLKRVFGVLDMISYSGNGSLFSYCDFNEFLLGNALVRLQCSNIPCKVDCLNCKVTVTTTFQTLDFLLVIEHLRL